MFWRSRLRVLIFCLGLWFVLDLASRLGAEIFWFQEVDYLPVFLTRLLTQGALWLLIVSVSAVYLLGNLLIAQRCKYPPWLKSEPARMKDTQLSRKLTQFLSPQYNKININSSPVFSYFPMKWRLLLLLTCSFSLLLGLMVAYFGEVAVTYWHGGINQASLTVPALFRPEIIWQLCRRIIAQGWYLGAVVAVAIAILLYPQFLLWAIAILFILGFGWMLAENWPKVLLFFHSIPFHQSEPLFGQDISFYIFSLPVWEILGFWLTCLCLFSFAAVILTYLLSGDSLSQGFFPGFSPSQQRHLSGLSGLLMLVIAFNYWLSCYELVYSPRGVSFGASYTDVKAQLPANIILGILAVAIAIYLLWRTVFWQPKTRDQQLVIYSFGVYLGLVVIGGLIIPTTVQNFIVQPNELQREQPYIQHTIALTRQAFGLDAIDAIVFNPKGTLTKADLQANQLTVRNIRLWDEQPLLQTNRQLQQIRPYYRFPNVDVDRYTIKTTPNPEKRQVLIAARELDYNAVPQQAKTWVNRNLIYTHGFGFTMSPVNTVAPGGLPEYFVKDISGNSSTLTTSSPAIRESIPIGQPRIYYGEITNTYVMTGTIARELDYPSGSENVYNTYDGLGGVEIGNSWRKWLFAMYLKDWQMLFTRDFLPETRVLYRRNITHRLQAIAPFIKFDSDPYLVVADANPDFPGTKNYLYWMIDGYTTSDRYPYSDTGQDGINYIRNSVKAVIDAYNGTVRFYIADNTDPLITAWSNIFPQMFKPLKSMPVTLRSHIRYPIDFFKIQSERLMVYHMTDPQVFYNREDLWQIPNEIYGDKPQQVQPYYLTTSLPNVPFEEFILLLPYTPKQRTNLIAWLAARSDGENYGKLLLYNFPKERLVYGTEQIEARINQDPVISQQISLWNRQGSRVIQGNLLVIPIEKSLLYVEPIYLEATQNSLPTLVRIVVVYENKIIMAQTLEQALEGIFTSEVTPAPAIIRPVEEGTPPS
ncbi:MAG TPA: UPF0182 family protein [Nostocaceae cyanobacterium]|nr:UPF0182 family protein [Nostocaceae cyanobacterium]